MEKFLSPATSVFNNTTCSKTIPSCKDLRKLNLHLEKNKKNEERAIKLKNEYMKQLDIIIKKNSQYETISLVDDISLFINERNALKNNSYYGYTNKNTFEDTILHIIEWFKDYSSTISFKTFERIIETLIFEKNSRYFIKNIIDNPFDLIQIQFSPIKFNQAYRIVTELNIPFTDQQLMDKWSISAVEENGGSFYKIKSHIDSEDKYKIFSDKPFRQGWYYLLRQFCEENNILSTKYKPYLNILNELLVPHKTSKFLYGIKEFVEIEKNIGDIVLDNYYNISYDIDIEKFNLFIHKFEQKKSTSDKPFKFTDEQIGSIKYAITNKLCIITGPPGTGKSTIVEAIIEWFNQESDINGTEYNISLMAPTGKALKGLIDKCKNIRTKEICGTLHKCILNTFPKIDKELEDFTNGVSIEQKYPQSIDKIIVDEVSMVDIFMFKKLLKACKHFDGCSLILCGDIKQLPPVGKGRPFECIIKSGLFNTMYLNDIKRQDSGKLKDCIIKINKRELTIKDFDNNSTIFIEHDFTNTNKTSVLCQKIVDKYGKENIAFITPENKKISGVFEMNKLLQNDVYNPNNYYEHAYFKEGDYVMRTENKYNDDVIRVNGDTGKIYFKEVTKINKKTNKTYIEKEAWVNYDDNETPMEEVALCDLKDKLFKLNYCSTVHKYQGSQKDVVVFIASPLHWSITGGINRLKLAYTAISRAAKTLIILGDKATFFNIQKCKEEPFISSFMKEFNDYEFE
jgi:energy-coupling factor transporter ATP-binding protein EcfA2